MKKKHLRLKEENNNKAMNDYAHAIDESWYRELYDDYKSRCEKAVEYIKDNCSYEEDTKYCYDDLCSNDVNNLLNILQNGNDSQ